MRNALRLVLAAAGMLLAISAYAADHVVQELNSGDGGSFVFSPSYVAILPGDTITFQPADQGHNSESVFLPAGAKAWKSEISKPLTVTFIKPGVYIYQCAPHGQLGMLGIVVVGKPSNFADAQKAAADIELKQLMNKGRLTDLMKNIH